MMSTMTLPFTSRRIKMPTNDAVFEFRRQIRQGLEQFRRKRRQRQRRRIDMLTPILTPSAIPRSALCDRRAMRLAKSSLMICLRYG